MAAGEERSVDFYSVLGLEKECTVSELKNAYKELALRWHPDRCSASGNSKFVDEAKKKFQAIQEAYSVLSDPNKRFMYDIGIHDSDDDENGMSDFLDEMSVLMSQTKPCGKGQESFEELQELFNEMFQRDIETEQSSSSSSFANATKVYNNSKRSCSNTRSGKVDEVDFDAESIGLRNFCVRTDRRHRRGEGERRRESRKRDLVVFEDLA